MENGSCKKGIGSKLDFPQASKKTVITSGERSSVLETEHANFFKGLFDE